MKVSKICTDTDTGFLKTMEGISPFCEATDTAVLGFEVNSRVDSLACMLHCLCVMGSSDSPPTVFGKYLCSNPADLRWLSW